MASFITEVHGTNTATLGTHQVGDVFVAFAFRDGAGGAPSIPAGEGWSAALDTQDSNNCSFVIVQKTADSTTETVGTFTNANCTIVHQYRPGAGETITFGAVAKAAHASNLTVNTPALTLQTGDGTSWVIAFMGHRSGNLTGLTSPPTGMTNRAGYIQSAATSIASNDTNGGTASWSQQSVTYGGSASAYQSVALEMKVAVSGPTVTSFNGTTPTHLGALPIVGTGLPTELTGSAGATMGGTAQTLTCDTATSASIASLDVGNNRFATNLNFVVTDSAGNASANYSTQVMPRSGGTYVNLSAPLASSGVRITAIPDLDGTEQLEIYGVVGGTIDDLTFNADGTFSFADGVTGFYVRAHNSSVWGTPAFQTIVYASAGLTRDLTSDLVTDLTTDFVIN